MTPEMFLQELLTTQDLSPEDEKMLQAHKKEVTDFLRAEFGDAPHIKYAGSHEKGTMIAEQYDLDIVCYFPSSDTRSLKEIREGLATHLKNKYLTESKASAERITNLKGLSAPDAYHIDVVPGRFIEGTKDVFLHVAYGEKERMQTNLKTHIDHIVNSKCAPIIRLAKLWAHRNNIGIKTFVLELFVIHALSGIQHKNDLQKSFAKVLEAFRDDFETVQLIDPANTNNVVSRLVSPAEKSFIAHAAQEALSTLAVTNDTKKWKAVFCVTEEEQHVPRIIPNQGFTPFAPWCPII